MNDELDTLACRHADLEEAAGLVGADQHHEVVKAKHSNRVAIGVQHVVIADSVLAALATITGSITST